MIDNKWFCEPDDGRECWCFLMLKVKDQGTDFVITGWELGYGNPSGLLCTINSDEASEKEIIESLLREIHYCRKKGSILITFGTHVLPAIRTRVVLLSIKDVSLRGLKHICIQELMEEYFIMEDINPPIIGISELANKMNIEIKDQSRVGLLRELFMRLAPIFPDGVF